MNTSMNARSQKTRAALREALLSCMKEKPVKDISVAEICRRAGLERTTFYKHYKEIDDMTAELRQEQIDRFRAMLQDASVGDEELIRHFLSSLDEAEMLFRTKDGGELPDTFKNGLVKTAMEFRKEEWKERVPNIPPREAELIYEGLLSGALQMALSAGNEKEREMVTASILNMVDGFVKASSDAANSVRDLAKQYSKKYEAVMIADLDTGLFRTVSAKDGVMTDAGPVPFPEAVLNNVLRYVHDSDRQKLIEGVGDFGRIKREYAIGESRDIEYRSSNGSEYIWYCITLNRVSENELLIALRSCNDEVISRIVNEKLLQKYEAVYIVDLVHAEVRSAKPSAISQVGGFSGKKEYRQIFLAFAETVDPRYKQDWVNFSNPDYLRRYMADMDTREYVYELPGAEKRLRRLTVDVIERVNGEAATMLFSFAGIDDISADAMLLRRRVTEQQDKLREALTFTNYFLDTYVSAYYVNFENLSCQVYKRTEELEANYPIVTNYTDSLADYIRRDVHPDDRERMLEVARPEKMMQMLAEKPEYSFIFRDISGGVEKTYRMQVIRGADEHHAAFGFIDISEEAGEQQKRLAAAEEAHKLVDNVAAKYSVAFTVNMATDEFRLLKLDRSISSKFESFSSFFGAKTALSHILHANDRKRIMRELEFDAVRENLKDKNSYILEYRTDIGGVTKWHEMNITAVDRDEVAMGFVEKDLEITKRRLENKRFDEYLALFVIDMDTEMIKPLKVSPYFVTANVGESVPYGLGMKKFAASYSGDAKEFFESISNISRLREDFAQDDKRTYSYKSEKIGDDKWIDVVSYAILRHDDGTPAMVTLGFSVVDALASARKELLNRLTENMQMIGGLADGYDALYYINIDENIFNIYTLNEEAYPGSRNAVIGKSDFYAAIRGYGMSDNVHPDDRHLFESFGPEAIRERLKSSKKYSMRFRVNTGKGYRWDEMEVVKYEGVNEQANAVAVGFAVRDAEIRSEEAINSAFDVLGRELPPDESVNEILSIAGDFYAADRCYVFEYNRDLGIINNTYEWCAPGTEPMIDRLQKLPIDVVEGWNREFERQGAFHMDALDSEHNTEETVAILEMQGIESLVASPLLNGDEIVGFIGVDNPAKAKTDISILVKASAVVYSEILKRRENDEEHVTLNKLTDAFLSVYYTDLSDDYMRTWKIDENYKEAYGSVQHYSEAMGGYVREGIAERDRERCKLMTSPEYVLEQFRTKDRFSIDMTDIMLGYERNIVFDYIKVNEDGSQFVACSRDVTDTLAKEREQQALLQDALDNADAANRSKTDFLFSMSHDIRTPMNAITGFTNMAVKNIDNKEKVLDCLDKTQKSGAMLLSLINSVLEVSRIESGHATVEEQPGDVYYSFANIETTMHELAQTKDIDLSFEYGDINDRFVYADFARCMRVFVNVISNAIKYTPDGGTVKVRCEQNGPAKDGFATFRYTVSDNGIGMSEEFQKHVFDQFAREQTSTVSGIQGSGLGMSVVKSFVELMGGTVTCESTRGKGTTFTVDLPFRLQEEKMYTDPVTGEVVAHGETAAIRFEDYNFSGRRVLLVEDNELNRELATEILSDEGLLVEEVEDGVYAVETLGLKGPDYYDFVLMDIQMPIMNGYEATKKIRAMYPDSKLPVIALSANAFAEDKKASKDAGMNDHVAKPINVKELFEVLAKYL